MPRESGVSSNLKLTVLSEPSTFTGSPALRAMTTLKSLSAGHQLIPETEHGCGQGLGPIFGKKQSSVRDFDHGLRARYGVFEPIGPFPVEEEVFEPPDDQRWHGEALQPRVNGHG